jgi:hypothetical protein
VRTVGSLSGGVCADDAPAPGCSCVVAGDGEGAICPGRYTVQRDTTSLRLVGSLTGPEVSLGPHGLSGDGVLKLVTRDQAGDQARDPARAGRPRRAARQHRVVASAVAAENRAAAGLRADDARAILAARVVQSLEGGRAAVLRPVVRKNLISAGAALGLRPFDTSLVIAIVQDRARAGVSSASHSSPPADTRLNLVNAARGPYSPHTGRTIAWSVVSALALAAAVFTALVRWITR